jgi:hypothetical protein
MSQCKVRRDEKGMFVFARLGDGFEVGEILGEWCYSFQCSKVFVLVTFLRFREAILPTPLAVRDPQYLRRNADKVVWDWDVCLPVCGKVRMRKGLLLCRIYKHLGTTQPVLLSLYSTNSKSKSSQYRYLAQILISCADMHLQLLTTLALLTPTTLASYGPALKEEGHNEGQVCPEFTSKYVCSNNKKHVVSFC